LATVQHSDRKSNGMKPDAIFLQHFYIFQALQDYLHAFCCDSLFYYIYNYKVSIPVL